MVSTRTIRGLRTAILFDRILFVGNLVGMAIAAVTHRWGYFAFEVAVTAALGALLASDLRELRQREDA